MKNKKTVLICVLILALLAVGIFIWKSCSSGGGEAEAPEKRAAANDEKTPDAAQATEETSPEAGETGEEATETESAQLIESEGDLIITIPEDEESDGF